MSEKNSQFFEVVDVHHSSESARDEEENLRSQLKDRRMTSAKNGIINATVALPSIDTTRSYKFVGERT